MRTNKSYFEGDVFTTVGLERVDQEECWTDVCVLERFLHCRVKT